MKRVIVMLGAITLLLFSSVLTPSISFAEKQDLKKVEQDRKEIKQELSQAEQQLADLMKEKKQLENEINALNDSLANNKQAMDEVEIEIDAVKKEIKEIEEKIEERFEILKDRAQSYQHNGGNIQYLEVLFGAKTFTEFISTLTAVTTIADADAKLIEEQENDKRKVEMKLSELEALQAELIEMEKLITEQKEHALKMQTELEEKNRELNQLISELKVKDEKLAAIEQSISAQISAPTVVKGSGSGVLGWPTQGGYISSYMGPRWGKMHKGIDIARTDRSTSPPIFAADSGTVEVATFNNGGFGNLVIINHGNGMKTLYAHLASIDVKAGQKVTKGQKIGIMGTTGRSTGIHLHFEVHVNGQPQNPMKYL